ncbi:MAG: NUDIX domain-containing protein [Candidatus Thalassarchaeaceae archaeon]|tara:strand:- start:145 stop:540 length:396 start_codon:yes stop_codon:yes gene_type:complete
MDNRKFVVVLALPQHTDDSWIMVKNKSRGWELPGGHLSRGELPEEAALRELYEETGILGTAKSVEGDLIPGGYVVLVRVEREVSPDPWVSLDESIEEVGWCLQVPESSAWGKEEVQSVIDHDWSASSSLES